MKNEQERIVQLIMNSLEERCETKEEVKNAVYVLLDVLYELYAYEHYRTIADEVSKRVDEKFDVFII